MQEKGISKPILDRQINPGPPLATKRVLVLVPEVPEPQAHWDHTVQGDNMQSTEKFMKEY